MTAQFLEEPNGDLRKVELVRSTPARAGRNDRNNTTGIEHLDGLFGYALVLTGNRVQAEDLVQETYVHALEAMSRLHENSNIKGWLFTSLRNLWLNELRRHRNALPRVEMDFDSIAAEGVAGNAKDSHETLMSHEEVEGVRAAIEKLPLEFREIILLREFEDFSYHEIAEVLGCSSGTVRSRLGRARAKLRSLLVPSRFLDNVSSSSARRTQ